jgi:hypothetical protein
LPEQDASGTVPKGLGSLKRFLLAAVLLLAPAGVAHAADPGPVQMTVRDVSPNGSTRFLAGSAPLFNLVGLHWRGTGVPWFRVRSLAGRWSRWEPADDDWGRDGVWRKGNAVWTGASDAIQVRPRGSVTRVREFLLWSPPVAMPRRHLQLANVPAIVTRAAWHADESIRRTPAPKYAPALKLAIVHHTASTNAYSCSRSASIVRGIEVYHVKGNGWDDIGYNFLVDACGQIFEGRWGGIDRNVVGAHSGGFNSGTVGVSLIGTYDRATPTQAAQNSLVKLLAWRLDIAHVDPLATVPYVSGGNSKFAAGKTVNLRAVSGHRDTYLTACPGASLYRLLPGLAKRIAAWGGPKVYAPSVTGTLGGPIRFTAKLSGLVPWTVTVTDAAGRVVATWSDFGTAVDWIWDSSLASTGGAYAWSISAGPDTRPATGTLGARIGTLGLTGLKVSPPLVSGAVLQSATVSFTLTGPATVTAELLDAYGFPLATLLAEPRPAGPQSFVFTPAELADGNYTIRVSARDATGKTVRATAPLVVSRTLVSFTADGKVFSPNGDGRRDTATFAFELAQPSPVTLALVLPESTYTLFSGQLLAGRQSVVFTGRALDGSVVPDGQYLATLSVGPAKVTLPLVVDTVAPTVALVALAPLTLRVYEQVTVIATVNGKVIRASKKAGVFTLARGQTVATLNVVVRDAAGNESVPVIYPRRRR